MDEDKAKEILKRAYELRDFEISLYWKRAQYFWGFIGVIFAGFFLTIGVIGDAFEYKISLALCSLGILFSLAWYLVNRGSKKWQAHWESVIVKYEKIVEFPVYLEKPDVETDDFFNAGNFSVSRVNIIMSFIVLLFWIGMWTVIAMKSHDSCFSMLLGVITVFLLFGLWYLSKTRKD